MKLLGKILLVIIPLVLGLFCSCERSIPEKTIDVQEEEELAYMKQAIQDDPDLTFLLDELDDVEGMLRRFNEGKRKAEEEWQNQQASIEKIKNLGATKSFEILPLIDSFTSREDLKSEAGVSYLIKTDNSKILFDLGRNAEESDPSPLLFNMKQLGISLDDIDTIVISHNHSDHVGGGSWSEQKTFSLGIQQIELEEKKVYTPIPMTYPGVEPIYSKDPTVIAEGVATIGTISNQLFVIGWIEEQALAVNVEGKGIVLISGCGHQTLKKVIDRAEVLFDEPVYGIIGGLHYPVDDSRIVWKGVKFKYLGTGKIPWRPITMEELQGIIDDLKKRNPGVVAVSPHDSSEAAIAAFREAFPEAYQSIEVGKKIVIDKDS